MKELIEEISSFYSLSNKFLDKIFITFFVIAFLIIKLIKLPFYLTIRLFICSHKGHLWKFYGGGFIGPSLKYGVYCKRCRKVDKS